MSDDDAQHNRELWTQTNQEYTDDDAEQAWALPEIAWGIFKIPERTLAVIGDVAGIDVVELGCGTAYFSAWLARRGARVVGVDVTPAQLATARRCQERFDLRFPLIEANAERVPLPSASFDLALSEYGACLWCDPRLWVPEAARLLRPGGRLVFLTSSVLVTLCLPTDDGYAGTELKRSQPSLAKLTWPSGGVEFHPSHGEWIDVLRTSGLELERLCELYAPEGAVEHAYYKIATPDWACKWPVEDLWVARKRA